MRAVAVPRSMSVGDWGVGAKTGDWTRGRRAGETLCGRRRKRARGEAGRRWGGAPWGTRPHSRPRTVALAGCRGATCPAVARWRGTSEAQKQRERESKSSGIEGGVDIQTSKRRRLNLDEQEETLHQGSTTDSASSRRATRAESPSPGPIGCGPSSWCSASASSDPFLLPYSSCSCFDPLPGSPVTPPPRSLPSLLELDAAASHLSAGAGDASLQLRFVVFVVRVVSGEAVVDPVGRQVDPLGD